MTLYLDCSASTPIEPRVQAEIIRCFSSDCGNAASSHEFGRRAKQLVHEARDRIARVVAARRHEVIFTSGATESNNLALLGLAAHGRETGRQHIVSTQIEHKAVLEPLEVLRRDGFSLTLVPPLSSGRVAAAEVLAAVRPDTLLVSVMHVNNETGICQPIQEIAAALQGRDVFFHVDAAQGFARQLEPLRHPRIDLISVSGHKIHAPQGVGALVARRRDSQLPPLSPLMYGGGQELGLRPGTLPVPLIVGFGLAAELAAEEWESRREHCLRLRHQILEGLAKVGPVVHGDPRFAMPHVLNLSFPGLVAEQVIEAWEGLAAVSDGAACTSVCATASHVLAAMSLGPLQLDGAIRLAWSHLTTEQEVAAALPAMVQQLQRLRARRLSPALGK